MLFPIPTKMEITAMNEGKSFERTDRKVDINNLKKGKSL